MNLEEIKQKLAGKFGDKVELAAPEAGDSWIEVAAEAWGEVAGFLKDDSDLAFRAERGP